MFQDRRKCNESSPKGLFLQNIKHLFGKVRHVPDVSNNPSFQHGEHLADEKLHQTDNPYLGPIQFSRLPKLKRFDSSERNAENEIQVNFYPFVLTQYRLIEQEKLPPNSECDNPAGVKSRPQQPRFEAGLRASFPSLYGLCN